METDKKTVLVVGASSGIGEVCARRLSRKGYQIVMVARDCEKMKKIAEKLSAKNWIYPFDLFDLEKIKSIFEFCKSQDIKLNGMVYSAGMLAECPVKANRLSMLQKSIELHCIAFYEMGKYYYSKKYSYEDSSIVAISSISSILCEQGMGPYSVGKAGLEAAVRTMAKEFLRRKIRVNAILPAGVDTPMAQVKSQRNGVDSQDYMEKQPLGMIPPENVASLVEYLLSDEARYITGAKIPISAGMDF